MLLNKYINVNLILRVCSCMYEVKKFHEQNKVQMVTVNFLFHFHFISYYP